MVARFGGRAREYKREIVMLEESSCFSLPILLHLVARRLGTLGLPHPSLVFSVVYLDICRQLEFLILIETRRQMLAT